MYLNLCVPPVRALLVRDFSLTPAPALVVEKKVAVIQYMWGLSPATTLTEDISHESKAARSHGIICHSIHYRSFIVGFLEVDMKKRCNRITGQIWLFAILAGLLLIGLIINGWYK